MGSGAAKTRFLEPSWKNLPPVDALPNTGEAARRILDALEGGRKVVVFGDYDTDGVCASAILARTFKALELADNTATVLPDRFAEGYGLTMAALERLLTEHPDAKMVVTVDNGITSANETAELVRRGIDVIVTDHHLPGDELPECLTVNPHVASCAGCDELCGAGVAFVLAQAIVAEARRRGRVPKRPRLAGELLVLAGVATVADVVPLADCNRDLVAESLRLFDMDAPIGLRELRNHAAKRAGRLSAHDYAFMLSPRINAAGRMAKADIAFRLLTTHTREEARRLAIEVDNLNAMRRTEENRIAQEALAQIDAMGARPAYVVAGRGWHKGVLGIVAGRLAEQYGVPVAVADGEQGSIRSAAGINVREALDDVADCMERYGGHAPACGFQLKEGRLEEFRERFAEACAKRATASRPAATACDFEISPEDVSVELWHALQKLQPFGVGNPEPVFAIKGVTFSEVAAIGDGGKHLSLFLKGAHALRALWWQHGGEAAAFRKKCATPHTVTFSLMLNTYGGERAELALKSAEAEQ